jgi:N-acetylglutamate synthase-like GNAT family acetyltransferase
MHQQSLQLGEDKHKKGIESKAKMKPKFEIKTVDASNVDEAGFFCYMSARKAPGYKQKREWLEQRFAEGLKIKIVHEIGGRDTAFIEYIPGRYAWRAIHAPGYMVIHCLWVVGKGRGKGYGNLLIQECLADARAQKMHGVVMLTSDRAWIPSREIFESNSFTEVASAPPAFQLMVARFGSGPSTTLRTDSEPALPSNWDARAQAFGPGLTVIRTAQCPYLESHTSDILGMAKERRIQAKVIEFKTAREVQQQSPSAHGIFGIVLDGQLLSYQPLCKKVFDKLLSERIQGG